MKKLRFTLFIMGLLLCVGFMSSCGDDDDDNETGGGSPSKVTNLVGMSFKIDKITYSDDGEKNEDRSTLTFNTSTKCTLDWYSKWEVFYSYNDHKTYHDQGSRTGTYKISGTKITVSYSDDPSEIWDFVYYGDYLLYGNSEIWKKQ